MNAINEVFNYAELRERGSNKKKWVIEVNHTIYEKTKNGWTNDPFELILICPEDTFFGDFTQKRTRPFLLSAS